MRLAGRRLSLLALLALAACRTPAWELPPEPGADRPVTQEGQLQRGELANGLDLLVLEDRRLPRVTLGLALRRGGESVAPEQAGLAGFTAELMKRGAGERDALALAEAVDRLGASLSVQSDWDSTVLTVRGLSRDLDALLAILADVALRPRFDPAEAERARSEILARLEHGKDDPETLASWHFARALYPGHVYGLPESGSPETVARFDAEAARRFHAQVMRPAAAIFFAAGDLARSELDAKLAQHFGAWEPGPVLAVGPPPPAQAPAERRIFVVDQPELGQVQIRIGHEGVARSHPDRVALGLLNTVFGGGGFSSRLMDRLRAEAGLTYGVGSSFVMRRQPGPFAIGTFTRVAEVRRVIDLLLAEIERLRSEPPTEQELRDAKALRIGGFALSLETADAVIGELVDLEIHDLPPDSLDTYRGRVRAVTMDDTARLALEHLHPERTAIVLVGPAAQIVPQLEGLGPVEVVQP